MSESIKKIVFVILIVLSSCKQSEQYSPTGLTKLSQNDVIEMLKNGSYVTTEDFVYRNEKGDIITLDSISKIENISNWTADSYMNKNNKIEVLILRKATATDRLFEKKIKEISISKQKKSPQIKIFDVDCRHLKSILQNVFETDQNSRREVNTIDEQLDRNNLSKVISIIEKCGMPTLETVNQQHMTAVWLVFQHSDSDIMKKYFPLLKNAASKGDLELSKIALMEDRILMFDNKPQIYGSQIIPKDDGWALYDLKEPSTVDERRKKVGLGPLKEYLSMWNIDFTIEQQ